MAEVGRPTLYDPAFCERVIEMGKEGKSPVQMAVGLGVARTTLLAWCEAHPDFLTAFTYARDLAQDWWETTGQTNLATQGFNASLYNKIISARFREDYTERQHTEVSGAGFNLVIHSDPK
ncbi:MAG TPA: hypothetical protein VM512_14070 [Burkholderiaceae bacterium]|nr:hypothetical protein [Burkholderiaceae bacterium]